MHLLPQKGEDFRKEEEKKNYGDFLEAIIAARKEKETEELIADIVDVDGSKVDPDIHDILIEDNELFENDDITDEDKEFIRLLIEKTDF